MGAKLRQRFDLIGRYFEDRILRWRTGSIEGQITALSLLMLFTIALLFLSLWNYDLVPTHAFILPILTGGILLRSRPLAFLLATTLSGALLSGVIKSIADGESMTSRISTMVVLALGAGLFLYLARINRSGLPGPLGDMMLMELRDRLQWQGAIPPLPDGWESSSETASMGGSKFAGDFVVARMSEDQHHLEIILVDVCGKGVTAGTQSLQLAGALGGLIGSLPQQALFAAANDFLLRQNWSEGFATAVHVNVNLVTGVYSILNAGHPPAMHWDADAGEWVIDGARGVALGVVEHPEFEATSGVLATGEALLFYTDGVIETKSDHLEDSIMWLQQTAKSAVAGGMARIPATIVHMGQSDADDCAALIVARR